MTGEMTPERERQLMVDTAEELNELPDFALSGMFLNYVAGVEYYADLRGRVPDMPDEDIVRLNVLRAELEERDLIRFH